MPLEPSEGDYWAGSFFVPGSTGTLSVTGVGFTPQGVYFFGSNQTAEDTVVTSATVGVFGGIMSIDWDSSSILSQSVSVLPETGGRGGRQSAIYQAATDSSNDYEATAVSFDTDGFTVNFTTVPGATRRVHYLAWGNFDYAGAHRISSSAVLSLGWRPRSVLTVGTFDNGAGNGVYDFFGGFNHASFGGGSFHETLANSRYAQNSIVVTTSGGGQHDRNIDSAGGDGAGFFPISSGNHYIGPFLIEGWITAAVTGAAQDQLSIATDLENTDLFVFWDGSSDSNQKTPAASAGGTVTQASTNAEVYEIQALLFYSSGPNGNTNTNVNGGIGFGVWTEDYQGCVLASGEGASRTLFQSATRAWCSSVQPAGAHAGTAAVDGSNTVTLTTVLDGTAAWPVAFHMFGPPELVPVIYRHGIRYLT